MGPPTCHISSHLCEHHRHHSEDGAEWEGVGDGGLHTWLSLYQSDSGVTHGGHVTVSLSWPRLEMDTTDLEFTVELTPDRKLEGKLGWECSSNHNNTMVYFDIKGSNPYIGDYIIQRNGHYEKISGTEHKLTWTGKAEFAKGPLAMYSPIDTNIVTSVNTANLHVDANVVKSFGGRRWGFTLMNGKFTLIRP